MMESVPENLAPASTPGTPKRSRAAKVVLVTAGVIAGAGLLGWAGLQVEPNSFPRPEIATDRQQTIPLPVGLPPPVERFYETLYGQEVPVIEGAIISGRGTMRVSGITLPVRFRFTHDTGQSYRHLIEATIYGQRFMTVDETYINDVAHLDLPFGSSSGPNIDQGANLALWAEAIWMPAVWLSDPRVRWESVDDQTALLIVPFGDNEETITVYFNSETGLVDRLESMRFKSENDSEKSLWINEVVRWETIDGWLLPAETTVAWGDEGSPWTRLETTSIVYGADVDVYLLSEGG